MKTSTTIENLIPIPVSVEKRDGVFSLTAGTKICVERGNTELSSIGHYLSAEIAPVTGIEMPVVDVLECPQTGCIHLNTVGGDPVLGSEGYVLNITESSVALNAYQPAGVFRGVQTLRQLVNPSMKNSFPQASQWIIPAGVIRDTPRFSWRGAMLDVSRHFFTVEDVKRFIDLLAYYKLNVLHLHLSDDQGWRVMIQSWPNLALHGGSTEVGGGPGGFYTQAEYSEIVSYSRFISRTQL